ncbi:non-ribosomal peptide synthetase family protein [Gorillibacterium timonense]|uniref:non-ribosomal peptide synthetase family protein n=1 Tax=Gorillibacterium timonense TaxID=1689269 RepID=UPI00071C3CC0|nr:non-ribosomal peptide synthetase [Gorillibacterium timonense]
MKAILANGEENRLRWLQELAEPVPQLGLPADNPERQAGVQTASAILNLHADDSEVVGFLRLRNRGGEMASVLTLYMSFLHRMTLESDLLIGLQRENGSLVPLRVVCDKETTFSALFRQIRDKLLWMERDVPGGKMGTEELPDVAYSMLYGTSGLPGENGVRFSIERDGDAWALTLAYYPERFTEATIQRFLHYMRRLARVGLADPGRVVASADILTLEDRWAYSRLNDTAAPASEEITITEWFSRTAYRYGSKIALSCGGDFLTYRELHEQSNQIASYLRNEGLKPGEPVALYMERSIQSVVSLLGVLKAGGAYVPVDPSHPADRNAYIIRDTKARFALSSPALTTRLEGLFAGPSSTKLRILNPEDATLDQSVEALEELAHPDALAYLIYTSGSTGTPKGAMITHQAVVNLVTGIRRLLNWSEDDIIAQYSTFSFDASVFDLFGALLLGAHLHLLEDEERFSVESFTAAIAGAQATQIGILPPVFFSRLAAHLPKEAADRYSTVKNLLLGGEALQGQSVRLFQQKVGLETAIVNVYGPTECTSVTTTHTVDYPLPENVAIVSIGKPMANYRVYIVNELNRLCPPGVTGELIIESPGVGLGYLNQPEKTREAFIPDPFRPSSGKRFYRTGDLAKLCPDGELEYAGRRDNQVKIRGYRIEIGEIEDHLAKHVALGDVAVVAMPDTDGSKMLTAFYTLKTEKRVTKSELVSYLEQKLPSYMIPKHFRQLPDFPLSPNRKIDRKALVQLGPGEDDDLREDFTAPRTALETEVAAAWGQALGLHRVGLQDNFFTIGGYSLKILETLVLMKPRYPQLKIADFFAYPTVEEMAERILALKETGTGETAEVLSEQRIGELAEYPSVFGKTDFPPLATAHPHVFLTGATGYLGSRLLNDLLMRPEVSVTCLVRKRGDQPVFDRLADSMEDYFGHEIRAMMAKRVTAVEGDMEKEGLGLSEDDHKRLIESVDLILHCGAEVRHFGSEEHFARTNVDSTRRLLELAACREGIRFHFISTMGIPEELALAGKWEDFVSSGDYDYSAAVENVYTNSKLEAEKLVIRAGESGAIPVAVYRVGNLCCDSVTGRFQRNIDGNAFYRMLKAMLLLKKAPKVQWEVDLTPIDYAGWSITELALQPDSTGRLFHICNPHTISYEDLVELFREEGYSIEWMDNADYEKWLLDPTVEKDRAGTELAMVHLEGDGAKQLSYRYACPNTVSRLSGGKGACPIPDKTYIHRLIEHAVSSCYFPKGGLDPQ